MTEDIAKKLFVTETFLSIQGESSFAGQLCFFIRLAGCNLRCSYCDTVYSQEISAGSQTAIEELLEAALKSGVKIVEITGGEPLTQDAVSELCFLLISSGFKVLVETNGSLPINLLPAGTVRILDCKTPSSGEADKMDFGNYEYINADDEIKFVISDYNDYKYSLEIISRFKLTEKTEKLIFSPAWNAVNLSELCKWMIEDRVPARFQLQLHKYIWGPEKTGV